MNRSTSNLGRIANNYRVEIYSSKPSYRSKGFFGFRLIDTLTYSSVHNSGRIYRSHKDAMAAGKRLKEIFRNENETHV